MKTGGRWILFMAGGALLCLSGCATSRSVLQVSLPESTAAVPQLGRQVLITAVTDRRVFEESPKTQDIPSLGFGGAAEATAAMKLRAIGRKRNTYGKALGDILLAENQTVETVARGALEKSLRELGYEVIADPALAGAGVLRIEAGIDRFWTYMTPGFWAIRLSADIATTLTLSGGELGGGERVVAVKYEGSYQVATDGNWQEVVDKALAEYVEKAKVILAD